MASYRIALVSDPAAGKTTLINTVVSGEYKPDHDSGQRYGPTDDDEHTLSINIDGIKRELSITDGGRAGASGGRMDFTFREIPMSFTNANAIAVCYDTSNLKDLRRSFRLLKLAQRDAGIYGTPVFLVGLKVDQRADFTFEDGQREANEHLCDSYHECSAKTGQGINELFSAIVHELDAIKERTGSVPLLPSYDDRQAAYRNQARERRAEAADLYHAETGQQVEIQPGPEPQQFPFLVQPQKPLKKLQHVEVKKVADQPQKQLKRELNFDPPMEKPKHKDQPLEVYTDAEPIKQPLQLQQPKTQAIEIYTDDGSKHPQPLKRQKPLMAVKGGARPAKEASPCIIQ